MMMKRRISLLLVLLLLVGHIQASALSFPFNFGGNKEESVTITKDEYERLKKYEKLDEVRAFLDQYYYQEPDENALLDGAIQGLLAGTGDVYTFYYPEESWNTMWEEDEGKYAGIGIQMLGSYETNMVTITRVFKGTPAESAGIRKGDVLYKVEELEITVATLQDAVNVMRGTPGEKVHVELLREGEVLPFDVTKAEIIINRVESMMLEENIGYIAHYEFAGDSFEDFKRAFDELTAAGMEALIIDLRDNGGGWVQDGIRLADMFLDKKLLFYTENRQGREDTFTQAGMNPIPLVILVNENSASTSEIVSAAMKDYKRATLVGVNTFGKGLIQMVMGLSDGKSGFQFTSAQYFSPLGNQVHKEGVKPDIEVELPDEMVHSLTELGDMSDPQLKAAYDEALKLLSEK